MIEMIVVSTALSFFLLWLFYNVIRPYYLRRRNLAWLNGRRIKRARRLFDMLYDSVDAFGISKKARASHNLSSDSLTYGEIQFLDYAAVLEIVVPKPTDIFYDLGAGSGKALLATAMLHDVQSIVGIECVPELCALAEKQIEKFSVHREKEKGPAVSIQMIRADFLEHDFSDANIVLINVAGLSEKDWSTLVEKLKRLKSGSQAIVISKSLPEKEFQLIDARMREMSWGLNSVYIYTRLT